MDAAQRDKYLEECRTHAVEYVAQLVAARRSGSRLYGSMLEYPMRAAKGLRPALCIAICRALGGALEEVIPSAAVLELYHNAFLIHDDVEDGSQRRRHGSTLHQLHGVAFALNVGDAMLALALQPLLENMATLDMGRALRILRIVQEMAMESAEGQALELEWIHACRWDIEESDYVQMVAKKTAHYSFIAPLLVGAAVANGQAGVCSRLKRLGYHMGVAFQTRDDVLNLTADTRLHGKEPNGDLWEGKRTLILARLLTVLQGDELRWAQEVLEKGRPGMAGHEHLGIRAAPSQTGPASSQQQSRQERRLAAACQRQPNAYRSTKGADEIERLRRLIEQHACVEHAQLVADKHAAEAIDCWSQLRSETHAGVDRDFLDTMVEYVAGRLS